MMKKTCDDVVIQVIMKEMCYDMQRSGDEDNTDGERKYDVGCKACGWKMKMKTMLIEDIKNVVLEVKEVEVMIRMMVMMMIKK